MHTIFRVQYDQYILKKPEKWNYGTMEQEAQLHTLSSLLGTSN